MYDKSSNFRISWCFYTETVKSRLNYLLEAYRYDSLPSPFSLLLSNYEYECFILFLTVVSSYKYSRTHRFCRVFFKSFLGGVVEKIKKRLARQEWSGGGDRKI